MHAVVDLDVDLEGGADQLRAMPPDRRSDVLFIAREALSNVARHAGATQTALVLARRRRRPRAGDRGQRARASTPPPLAGPDGSGATRGSPTCATRAEGMGGTFAVERPADRGTRIIVRVPVDPSAAGHPAARPPRRPENPP